MTEIETKSYLSELSCSWGVHEARVFKKPRKIFQRIHFAKTLLEKPRAFAWMAGVCIVRCYKYTYILHCWCYVAYMRIHVCLCTQAGLAIDIYQMAITSLGRYIHKLLGNIFIFTFKKIFICICKCFFYKQAILMEFDHFRLVITKEIVNPCGGVQIQTALLAGILYSISVFNNLQF